MTSLGRRGVPKPCFHPQGQSILIAQGTKVYLQPIPQIEGFSLKRVLDTQFSATAMQDQFKNLIIQDCDMQESNSSKAEFDDPFFSKLLSSDLPSTHLFST